MTTCRRAEMDFERAATVAPAPLIDPFGRAITYLRVSVTDRCDFRCVYCMAENMTFLPKADLLTLEELDRLCSAFVAKGVRKLRLTGGEPLVRRGIMTLFHSLSRHLGDRRARRADAHHQRLAAREIRRRARGLRRRSASTSRSTRSTPTSSAPSRAGASSTRCWPASTPRRRPGSRSRSTRSRSRASTRTSCPTLIDWAHGRGMDLTLIEVMPLGDVGEQRLDQYLPLSLVRARLAERFTLDDIDYRTGGPARYVRVAETGGRLGFITPLTHNFCEICNRVRLTCTGTLYMCLGQEDAADLRAPLRASEGNDLLYAAIDEAITRKPKGHDFVIDRRRKRPAVARHMSPGRPPKCHTQT